MFNQTKEVTFMKNQSTDTLTGKSKISTALFVIFASIAITILLLGNANKGYASTANSLPNKSQSKFMVTRGDPACGPDVYLPAITSNSSWWEMEPNNSIESANGPLLSGYVYFGYPDAAGIGDFYFLDMDIDGQITIQLSDYDVPGGQLQLFDAQRNQVGFDQEPPFHIEYAGSAGRYYVRIVASSAPDRQQRYSLRATYPSPQLPQLYFSDDFCGDSIDTEFWLVDEGDLSYFSVQDGRLKTSSQPITNCDQGWCQHMLNDLGIEPFSQMEIKAVLTAGSDVGVLGFNTSCTAFPFTTLVIELNSSSKVIAGRYFDASGNVINLDWGYTLQFGEEYKIRVYQNGEVAQASINGIVMEESFPCPTFGLWINLFAGSLPGGYVVGDFDYVRLFTSP
jgi:hypothetical protein